MSGLANHSGIFCIFVVLTTCLALSSAIDLVRNNQFGTNSDRAPASSCPSQSSHCKGSSTMPWACPGPKLPCSIPKAIGNLTDQFSSNKSVNLTASVYYFKNNYQCMQALNLTWTAAPIDYVGYLLKQTFSCPSRGIFNSPIIPKRFVLNRNVRESENRNKSMLFHFDCQKLAIASSYLFELHGLHNDSDSSFLRPELIGIASLETNCDTYPEGDNPMTKWTPFIHVVPSDGNSTIKIYFTPAPSWFRFISYHVLVYASETLQLLGNASNLYFTCTHYRAVVFSRVCSGNYTIQVHAFGDKCPCGQKCDDCKVEKSVVISGSKYPCSSGILLETPSYEISSLSSLSTDDVSGGMPLSDPKASRLTTYAESRAGDPEQTTIVTCTIVTAAIFVGVIVAGVMASRIYKDVNGAVGKKRSVLLIYAKDNAYHCNAVQCFASYLQQHCYCDVKLDQWCPDEISEISAVDWLLLQIGSAENIIVVNSEGGWRQNEGDARGVAFQRIRSETPLEDMFLLAIKELRNKRQKLFKVAFPYTHSKFFINDIHPSRTYALMNHIEDLFFGIQHLSKRSVSGKKLAVDINASNYTKCREGQLFETAVREAGEFLLANPDWFSEFYYQKEERKESVSCLTLLDSLQPNYLCDHGLDSGLGLSINRTNITSSVLMMSFEDERQGIKLYPPSDLDDSSESLSRSAIDERFGLMNVDYENSMTQ